MTESMYSILRLDYNNPRMCATPSLVLITVLDCTSVAQLWKKKEDDGHTLSVIQPDELSSISKGQLDVFTPKLIRADQCIFELQEGDLAKLRATLLDLNDGIAPTSVVVTPNDDIGVDMHDLLVAAKARLSLDELSKVFHKANLLHDTYTTMKVPSTPKIKYTITPSKVVSGLVYQGYFAAGKAYNTGDVVTMLDGGLFVAKYSFMSKSLFDINDWYSCADPSYSAGPTRDQGMTGPAGSTGDRGPAGPTGDRGLPGTRGQTDM